MKTSASILFSVALLVALSASAKEPPKANPFYQTLNAVPAAELPAKSAELVAHAKARERHSTTVDVIKGAVGINPAATPAIVGAVARAVPDMAAVAAGTAAAEQPKQAAAVAKAAAAAAPANAGKIVTAVCRAVPNEYRNIAIAVSQVSPGSNKEIIKAVAAALPNLKPGLEQALSGRGASATSVATVLDQAATISRSPSTTATLDPVTDPNPRTAAVAPLARGPAVGPPYIPLSATPTNVASGSSGEVPTGGRDYAAP